jgi:hypothetical protein
MRIHKAQKHTDPMAPDADPEHTNTTGSLLTYGAGSKKVPAVFVLQLQLHFLVLLHHSQPAEQLEELGPWKSRLFWAPSGTCLTARCHFTGPKNEKSLNFQGPTPSHLPS